MPFEIPAPFKVWCNLCNVGFMTIAESQQHDKDNLLKHQEINGKRREDDKSQSNESQTS